MSRSWCPALAAADEEATKFDTQFRVGSPPRAAAAVSPRPASPARLKSLLASKSSAASQAIGSLSPRSEGAAKSQGDRFSSRIAISAFNAKCFSDLVAEDVALPFVEYKATTADESSSTVPLPPKLTVRSVAHLDRLKEFASTSEGLYDDAMSNVSLARIDLSSEELQNTVHTLRSSFPLLRGLDLSHTMRGSSGVGALCRVLNTAPTADGDSTNPLRLLDISDNPAALADDGAEAFGKLLHAATNLNFLNLASTGVGASLATIAPLLLNHPSITSLNLGSNAIGIQDEAVVAAVAAMLQENKFLLQVDLSNNELTGATTKQLLDAIAASDTRAKTPEAEPDPEVEEYADEAPPEEEAPNVNVGLPQEESEKDKGGVEEPTGAAAADDAAPAEDAAPPPAEEAQEGADADVPLETEATESVKPTTDEAEDPEEAAARREAAEEAQRQALDAEKEAWKEKMTKYIWEPQQILFIFDESKTRRAITVSYVSETLDLKKQEKAAKKEAKARQLAREKKDRDRRSGWTHLASLSIANNPITSDGAKALARLLMHDVPLSQEEQQTSEEEYHRVLAELRDVALLQRKKTLQEKRRDEKNQQKAKALQEAKEREEAEKQRQLEEDKAKKAADAAAAASSDEQPAAEEEEEVVADAEDGEPKAEAETDEAPAPAADEEAANVDDDDGGALNALDEIEDDIPDEEIDVSDVTAPAPKKAKPGVSTLQTVDASSCKIGSQGLRAIAAVVKDNSPSLRALLLANNKFGTKRSVVTVPKEANGDGAEAGEDDGGEGEETTIKVEVPEYVSPGFAALADAIGSPKCGLVSLDLSRNKLYPNSIITLANGLKGNATLLYLNLNDNNIGFRSAAEAGTAGSQPPAQPAASALLALGQAISKQGQLQSLLVSNNELFHESDREAWAVLFQRCSSLRSLDLSLNNLSNSDLRVVVEVVAEGDGMQQLRYLNLGGNNGIEGDEAGQLLAQLCAAQKKLKTLNLRSCQLFGDSGLAALCEGLVNHASLQNLILRRTGISYAEPLGQVLPSVSFLRHLDLADNELSAYASKKLLSECVSCPSLRSVSIWSRSSRDDEDEDVFLAASELAGSRTLQFADLGAPLAFDSKPAGMRFTPPPTPPPLNVGGHEHEDAVDPLQELEWLCLRNRLIAASSKHDEK